MEEFVLHWPTQYPVITQGFGKNPQNYPGLPGHEGVDLRAPLGSPITACAGGIVYRSGWHEAYGYHIRIDHDCSYKTIYGHLSQILVVAGELVSAGQLIGKAGNTGNSRGAHLHLTLKRDGATARKETIYPSDIIDPTPFLKLPDVVGRYYRVIASSGLRLRAKPSVNDRILLSIPYNGLVIYNDVAFIDAAGKKWYKVSYEGQVGWVLSVFVDAVVP